MRKYLGARFGKLSWHRSRNKDLYPVPSVRILFSTASCTQLTCCHRAGLLCLPDLTLAVKLQTAKIIVSSRVALVAILSGAFQECWLSTAKFKTTTNRFQRFGKFALIRQVQQKEDLEVGFALYRLEWLWQIIYILNQYQWLWRGGSRASGVGPEQAERRVGAPNRALSVCKAYAVLERKNSYI